jgi:transposase
LEGIPGVGVVTREVYLAEVADVRRFRSQKKVVAFAGLAPRLRESAGKRHELGITHAGSRLLRWVLCQAAWQLVRRDLRWRRIFEALAARRGRKKAITAVARRLLCVMTSMVMSGQEYRPAA